MSILTALVLMVVTLLTAAFSSVTGMAGGFVLLAVMTALVETDYIIPLHGAVQSVSSVSRFYFFFRFIKWRFIGLFSIGVLPGALIGLYVFQLLPGDLIKLLMGIFILVSLYAPKFGGKQHSEKIFIPLGFVSGMIGMFFGVSGPLISPYLLRDDLNKEQVIATKSTCQGLVHIVKIPLFGLAGANVFTYWKPLIILALASILGSWLGRRVLGVIPDRAFNIVFKVLLTLISLQIIIVQTIKLLGRLPSGAPPERKGVDSLGPQPYNRT